MAGQGYEFVIVNATTGEQTVSPALATNTQIARESGDLTGFYMFAFTSNDPALEVANFVAHSGVRSGDLVCYDLEEYDDEIPDAPVEDWRKVVANAVVGLGELKRSLGATPLIYLNWWWIQGMRTAATAEQWAELITYPLWLAEPTGVPGQHSTVTSQDGSSEDCWPILLHQYAVEPFMGGRIDRDWTPDLAALRRLAVP